MADPINRKIHEAALVHQAEFCVAKTGLSDCFCALKCSADFVKILSVTKGQDDDTLPISSY